MLKKPPSWISSKCPDVDMETETLYTLIGSKGILTSESETRELCNAACNAVLMAKEAKKSDVQTQQTKWECAADMFAALQSSDFEKDEEMSENGFLNPVSVLYHKNELENACRAVAMYCDSAEDTIEKLKRMAQLCKNAKLNSLIDIDAVLSQFAIKNCEEMLKKASMVGLNPDNNPNAKDLALEYQRYVAQGELFFNKIHPSVIPPDLQKKIDSVKTRIATTYSSTYSQIFSNEEKTFKFIDFDEP